MRIRANKSEAGSVSRPSSLLRYGVAVASVAVVLLLKLLLDPLITDQSPFLLLAGAVMVAAWYGGLGPGLLATALGALAADYFFLPPLGSFTGLGLEFLPVFLFGLQGLLITSLVEALRAARRRADVSTREAQSHHENLRRSEEHFRLLVEGVEDYAIFMLDPEGRVASWNARAERINGYRQEEILGRHFSIFYTDEDVKRGHPEEELRVATSGGRYQEEGLRVRKDGSRFWANVLITALRDEEGNLRGFSKVTRDITERKEAEQALKESEQRFRALVQNSSDIFTILEVDGTIRYESPSIERVLGYKPEDLIGKDAFDYVHPEDLERVLAVFAEGLAERGATRRVEFRFRQADGSWRHLEAIGNNLLDDPSVKGVIVTSRDVTERKRAEEALKESEERFRALVQNSSDIITVIDVDGTIRYVSPAVERLMGYHPEELVGKNVFYYVRPDGLEEAQDMFAELWSRPGIHPPFEFEVPHKDGSWRYSEFLVNNLLDDPSVRGVVVNQRDITERKEAEKQLRESEELYRSVVEQAAENIFLVDAETKRVLEANATLHHSLGYTTEELKQLTLYDIVAYDQEDIDRNIRRILEGHGFMGERRYRRKDGSLIDVEVSASAISYGGREVLCVVAHDITERKQAEDNFRQSMSVLLALREAGQILGSTLESQEIVTRLLDIMRGVSNLTTVTISIQDEVGRLLIWRSAGLEGLWRRARFAPEAEAARLEVMESGEHRLVRLRRPEDSGDKGLTVLYLPLRVKDRIVGMLEAYGPEELAQSETVEILASLSSQAASALENARLYEALSEREHHLQELVGKLLGAQEEERRRVAYEVHDGLAQVAVAAHQHLQAFAQRYSPDKEKGRKDLERILRLVRGTVSDARRIIANLRPTALDDLGLAATISLEVERLREEGYQVEYEEYLGQERLPDLVEVALFRVAQEALTNMRKHARTRRVRIELRVLGEEIRLEVRDYGRGFDPTKSHVESGPGERVGLAGMQERINLLGGKLEIHSQLNMGTSIKATVPLRQAS